MKTSIIFQIEKKNTFDLPQYFCKKHIMILYTCICTCILNFHKFDKRKKIMIGNDKLRLYIRPLDVTLIYI